jgi:hypothetical protein
VAGVIFSYLAVGQAIGGGESGGGEVKKSYFTCSKTFLPSLSLPFPSSFLTPYIFPFPSLPSAFLSTYSLLIASPFLSLPCVYCLLSSRLHLFLPPLASPSFLPCNPCLQFNLFPVPRPLLFSISSYPSSFHTNKMGKLFWPNLAALSHCCVEYMRIAYRISVSCYTVIKKDRNAKCLVVFYIYVWWIFSMGNILSVGNIFDIADICYGR